MDRLIKILVVEDEMIIGAKVSMYLTELGYEVTGIIPRAEEALIHLGKNPPDIALLDIRLKGGMDGIALAQVIQRDYDIPVIFLTANTDDATFYQAKETKPYAFLAKPFRKLDLQRALELTIGLMDTREPSELKSRDDNGDIQHILSDRIFVYYNDKKIKILFDNILYIEAERNYCRIITTDKDYLLTMPMKSIEDELPPTSFQRIHRSHIVNLTHVNEISEKMVKIGEKNLVISKSYRKEFLLRIKSI